MGLLRSIRRECPVGVHKLVAELQIAGLVAASPFLSREHYHPIQSIIFTMLRRGDELSARIGRSLERFLASVDALGDREREIIQLHRASLGRLADLQGESREERMEVVEGLETLVRRRLRD